MQQGPFPLTAGSQGFNGVYLPGGCKMVLLTLQVHSGKISNHFSSVTYFYYGMSHYCVTSAYAQIVSIPFSVYVKQYLNCCPVLSVISVKLFVLQNFAWLPCELLCRPTAMDASAQTSSHELTIPNDVRVLNLCLIEVYSFPEASGLVSL